MDDNRTPQRRLVTDFAELAVGMKLVISPCAWCGKEEQSFLIGFSPNVTAGSSTGEIADEPGFLEAEAGCLRDAKVVKTWITPRVVAAGIVFRVIDGLDRAQDEFEAGLDRIASDLHANWNRPLQRLREQLGDFKIREPYRTPEDQVKHRGYR